MREVYSIYVTSDENKLVYSHENFIQGSMKIDDALFSNFITAIQQFAKELGGEETKAITLSDYQIISAIDNISGYRIILKCDPKAKAKRLIKFANTLKNSFINVFTGHFSDSDEQKRALMNQFDNEIKELLKEGDSVSNFLKFL